MNVERRESRMRQLTGAHPASVNVLQFCTWQEDRYWFVHVKDQW